MHMLPLWPRVRAHAICLQRCERSRRRIKAGASMNTEAIVSPDWLKEHMAEDTVKCLDASWFLPSMGRNALEEYTATRIPGSKFFDIDGVADTSKPFPHMVPAPSQFAAAADALGIVPSDTVVIYDRIGTFSSPRAWWLWKIFGHERVAILAGGFPAWQTSSGPVEQSTLSAEDASVATAAAQNPPADLRYPAKLQAKLVKSLDEIKAALRDGAQVVDARAAGRFRGRDPEPRADVPPGHMKGAINVPFMSLLEGDQPSGPFKPKEQIAEVFKKSGVDVTKPMICTCGSGSTAAVLAHAVYQLGQPMPALYDASWMEWATTGNPIETEEDGD